MMHKLPIPARFLFRIAMPCRYREELDELKELPPEYEFPNLEALEASDSPGAIKTFRIRGAWNERGIAFQFFVSGKNKEIWCNPNRPDESDRVELWLDTRNVHNVHRATRYCHRLICLPVGEGNDGNDPVVLFLPINRAKQMPSESPNGSVQIRSKIQHNGYSIFLYISSEALTGYDSSEFQEIGINWALIDRDFPIRTLTAGSPFPFMEDPSLWYTIHLEKQENSHGVHT